MSAGVTRCELGPLLPATAYQVAVYSQNTVGAAEYLHIYRWNIYLSAYPGWPGRAGGGGESDHPGGGAQRPAQGGEGGGRVQHAAQGHLAGQEQIELELCWVFILLWFHPRTIVFKAEVSGR